jgi:hypothetical protein
MGSQKPGLFAEKRRYSPQKLAKNPVFLVLRGSRIGFKCQIF